jgi:uncharacterized membrane protein
MDRTKKSITNPLLLSLAGNAAMILARILYTNDHTYGFLLWNLFLAAVPLFISYVIVKIKPVPGIGLAGLLYIWLLFLPNAPYIVTDMAHLYARPLVPYWYDQLLVLISAVNGLVMGFVSIGHIESLIKNYQKNLSLNLFRILIILAMSYGVYIGRYLRFNSWDAIIRPFEVGKGMIQSIHAGTVGFVITFAFVNFVMYGFFRAILLYRTQEAA